MSRGAWNAPDWPNCSRRHHGTPTIPHPAQPETGGANINEQNKLAAASITSSTSFLPFGPDDCTPSLAHQRHRRRSSANASRSFVGRLFLPRKASAPSATRPRSTGKIFGNLIAFSLLCHKRIPLFNLSFRVHNSSAMLRFTTVPLGP